MAARSETDTSDFIGLLSIPIDSGDFTNFTATYGRVEAKAVFFGGAVETIAGATLTRTEAKDFTSAFGAPFTVAFNDRLKGGEDKFDVQTNIRWDGWGAQQRVSVLAETMRDTFDMLRLDLPAADQSQHQQNSGIAGEYWIGLNENVFVSLGARHDWNERFADSTTWRATVSARAPQARVRLHASAGTGVKNPDFFELFGFFPAPAFVGNPNLKPERSFGYDAGVEWHALNGVVLDATYFHADLEDEVFTDFSVFPNTARNAPGHSKREGIEVSANADLGGGLMLDAAYTYLDSQQSDGTAEVRRPHHIASVNLDYHFASDGGLLNLGVDFHGQPGRHRFPQRAAVQHAGDALVLHAGAAGRFVRHHGQHRTDRARRKRAGCALRRGVRLSHARLRCIRRRHCETRLARAQPSSSRRCSPPWRRRSRFASFALGAVAIFAGANVVGPLHGDGVVGTIAREIRLPRAALALVVGAALGASGAALQGLFRNPLAEPGVTGVSSCAGLGAVIALYFGIAAAYPLALPAFAIVGALFSAALLYLLARKGTGVLALVLAGVAISSLAGALTAFTLSLAKNPYAMTEMVLWLMGSLKDRTLSDLAFAAPLVATGIALLVSCARALDALTLGEEAAASLGINVTRARLTVVAGVALATGAATAAAGAVAFVGLVVPHLLRPFYGHAPGRLMLPSALGGAALVAIADVGVRLLSPFSGGELLLGVFTALIGAPFFFWLIVKLRVER